MIMDVTALLLRDFSDLTRPELIKRRKSVEILQARVLHTHEHISPRKQQSFVIAIAVLIVGYALTHFLLLAGVAALGAQIIVLRYSTLPLNWQTQLAGEIQKLEPLRHSPLRQWDSDTDFSWEYAQHCLNKEITLIHISLGSAPAPFDA
ncbi:hypothetical protein M8X74_004465 [Salmonella enterica]|uniref:Inner membrane protein n=1 Tax=Citrobacter meridianamericanus TaxID=2894201 RepID=A0ABT1BEP2_9ENTR|nr:hypothetical protein [Citrobacter meridianamericanus]EJF5505621.1 hypothetical protein [Salmonella enterica]EJF5595021.1 hypothetical protein [Salmonella enterica]EJF5825975.1 hypothetical protein [Salmonella enterica]EJF5844809.1 hypothetical protein [Salmonella enterica]EJF5917303.1 hypothetical protein [Salmonella enterica]